MLIQYFIYVSSTFRPIIISYQNHLVLSAALRSHDEISRIHIEKQCTEIDAKQSNARIAAVCDRIQSCFRSVKTAIVDDGISADAGVDNGDNWLDEAIRTVGERRNAIKSDWREIEETWNLGIDFTDRLAKSRAALTNINRFIVMFGLQKTLTKRLLRFERDEAALLADRRMLELFDGWTAAEVRRHTLIVYNHHSR